MLHYAYMQCHSRRYASDSVDFRLPDEARRLGLAGLASSSSEDRMHGVIVDPRPQECYISCCNEVAACSKAVGSW